jgi:ubiquilin
MQAFSDIQRATQVLAQEAPELATAMGIPRNLLGNLAAAGATPANNPPTTTSANVGGAPRANMGNLMDFLQQMNIVSYSSYFCLALIKIFKGAAAGGQQTGGVPLAPPEERFRSQLEQLAGMGFTDSEANIRGLSL